MKATALISGLMAGILGVIAGTLAIIGVFKPVILTGSRYGGEGIPILGYVALLPAIAAIAGGLYSTSKPKAASQLLLASSVTGYAILTGAVMVFMEEISPVCVIAFVTALIGGIFAFASYRQKSSDEKNFSLRH